MIEYVEIKCPYCGELFRLEKKAQKGILRCSNETGSCGRDFAYKIEFLPPMITVSKVEFN